MASEPELSIVVPTLNDVPAVTTPNGVAFNPGENMVPMLSTSNSVVVPVAVDEPIVNAGPLMPLGLTESCAHGDVVPIPNHPCEVKVLVAVAPKYAFWKTESCVVEALALNCCSWLKEFAVVVENAVVKTPVDGLYASG